MPSKFSHNDIVSVKADAPLIKRRYSWGWIVGTAEPTAETSQFPADTIYTLQFVGGESDSAHESWLDLVMPVSGTDHIKIADHLGVWIAPSGSIHIKTYEPHGDPVELTEDSALDLATALTNFAARLRS